MKQGMKISTRTGVEGFVVGVVGVADIRYEYFGEANCGLIAVAAS